MSWGGYAYVADGEGNAVLSWSQTVALNWMFFVSLAAMLVANVALGAWWLFHRDQSRKGSQH
jgi:hypothetical protein